MTMSLGRFRVVLVSTVANRRILMKRDPRDASRTERRLSLATLSSRWALGTCVLSLGGMFLASAQCGTGASDGQGPASGESDAAESASSSSGSSASGGSSGAAGTSSGDTGASSGESGAMGSASGAGSSSGLDSGGDTSSSEASASGGARDGGVTLEGGIPLDGPIFYVTNDDGSLYAFREGSWTQEIAKWTGLPITDGARGIDADPKAGILYITHGASGPDSQGVASPNGSLLAWSLLSNSVVYDVAFTHGVDQLALGDGVVYVPAGEYTPDSTWYLVRASDGSQLGTEMGGKAPHDTLFKNGHRYYGGTEDMYLFVLGLPITSIGPSPSGTAGVRPFTINAAETRVYVTWSAFRGFSVGDLTTGKLITTVNFGTACSLAAPSHGMSLSPDGTEVYVLDTCVNQVRVYDSSDTPQLKATVTLAHNIYPGTESPCPWDCSRDGWILHSRDGKYVYVGNSGDVIDTATHQPAGFIAPLANCRHGFLEMDWSNGFLTGTTTHTGVGY
mgnify:CR=1 FL=1